MKILLIGNTGQLGWELQRALQVHGSVVALDFPLIDMADADSIVKTVKEHHPQVIFNASAYTAVDKAETEPELAMAVNGRGPGVLAEASKKENAVLIHYSTDYLFDGKKDSPYIETDIPAPLNTYGKSKLAGEKAIQAVGGIYLIFRTAWVYSLRKEGFVSKVLGWARTDQLLRVVDDQVSNPTWARMLAELSVRGIFHGDFRGGSDISYSLAERTGIYHAAGDGFASRFEWAKKILELDPNSEEQVVRKIQPVATTEFPAPARRPPFSALDCTKFKETFGIQIPPWEQSLALAMKEPRSVIS